MKIEVMGYGSAFSKISNTSSILVSDHIQNKWLIDCGPTVPRALWQREIGINDIDVIYFTHIHPDHCLGLTALTNQWKSFGRSKPLDIFCQPEQQAPLKSLIQLSTWPETSLCFDVHWHDITDHFSWLNWQISTAITQHEISNRSIRIDVDDQSLFYSGDGRPTESSQLLMQDVDLAFQECASLAPQPENSSHCDFERCQQLVSETGVKALGLYHCFDESISALQRMVEKSEYLFMSQDGLVMDLADSNSISKDR